MPLFCFDMTQQHLPEAIVPAMEALRTLVGSGWRAEWARRCGLPFREFEEDMGSCSRYRDIMVTLEERGMGTYSGGQFVKHFYADLPHAAKDILKEIGVPAWSFGAHRFAAEVARPSTRRMVRNYATVLFDAAPPRDINNAQTFRQVVRDIVGKADCGDSCLCLKSEGRSNGRTLSGTCDASRCGGCTWKLLATLHINAAGRPHLLIKSDGAHGEKIAKAGARLWTQKEKDIIKTLLPGQCEVSSPKSGQHWLLVV